MYIGDIRFCLGAYLKRLLLIDKMNVYSDMDKYFGNWQRSDLSVVALIRISSLVSL